MKLKKLFTTISILIIITLISCTSSSNSIKEKNNSSYNTKENEEKAEKSTDDNKSSKKDEQIDISKIFNPFIFNEVNDKYNYPNLPSDGFIFTYYSETIKRINSTLNINKINDINLRNFIKLHNFINLLDDTKYSQLQKNVVVEIIELANNLENNFKKNKQFFKAKTFNNIKKGFEFILTDKTHSLSNRYQIMYNIAHHLTNSNIPSLINFSKEIVEIGLNEKRHDSLYYLLYKINLFNGEFDNSKDAISNALKFSTNNNNNKKLFSQYYYMLRNNKFTYTYNINLNISEKIQILSIKLPVPSNTKYQKYHSIKTFDNNKELKYKLSKNDIGQIFLNLELKELSQGRHDIKIEYVIETRPYRDSYQKLSKYSIDDYKYSSSIEFYGIKDTNRFNYNSNTVQNYVNQIKKSIPKEHQKNILYIVNQTYLYILNKLDYNTKMSSNPQYRKDIDSQLGRNAERVLKYPSYSVCENYACLMVSILRSFNIPSYYIFGPNYNGPYHAWIKIYDPDGHSYTIDPTYGDPIGKNGTEAMTYLFFYPSNRIEEGIIDSNLPFVENDPEGQISFKAKGGKFNITNYSTSLILSN